MSKFQNIKFQIKVIISIYIIAILNVMFPDFFFFKIVKIILWLFALTIFIYGYFIVMRNNQRIYYSEVFNKKFLKIVYFSFFLLTTNFFLLELISNNWLKELLHYQYLVMVYLFGIMANTGLIEKYFGKIYYSQFWFLNRKK